MGMDFSSFTLWSDYILFLKNVDAAGSYAENQKISAIRKIYHRGIVIPMLNVESLWYAYIISFTINLFIINTTVLCEVCLFQSKKRNSCLFVNSCPAHYKFWWLRFWFFRQFGCVIFFTLNFCFACLALLSKKGNFVAKNSPKPIYQNGMES